MDEKEFGKKVIEKWVNSCPKIIAEVVKKMSEKIG